MDLGLKGKVAIVAGASRGIGKAIAHSLAGEGCNLVLCARGEEALTATAQELSSTGVQVESIALDITEEDAGDRLVARGEEALTANSSRATSSTDHSMRTSDS